MFRIGLLCAALVGCAPVSRSVRRSETVGSKRTEQVSSRSVNEAAIETTGGDLSVRLIDKDFCSEVTVETYTRSEKHTKRVNKGVLVLEYVVGIGLGGAGGFALGSPDVAADTISPDFPTETARTAGGAVAAVGGLALLAAIIDSTRGGTSTQTSAPQTRKVGTPTERLCAERPVANRAIVVTGAGRKAALPPTDATGRTSASWHTLASGLFEGTAPPSKADVRTDDENGKVLGTIDLAAPRALVVDGVWIDVKAAGTARAAAAFRTRFPGDHAAEVDQIIASKGDSEMDAALSAALAGNDLAGARLLLDEWGAWLPASTQRKVREPDVAAREIEVRVSTTIAAIDVALTTGEEITNLGNLTRAATLSGELSTFAPTDPRTPPMVAKVAKARAARQRALFDRAVAAEKAGTLDQAIKLSDLAVEVLPDPKATKRQTELRVRIARRHASDSKKSTRAKDFTLAAESLSRAEALAKDDREVVASRKALDKAQATAEASITNATERARIQAEREAQADALRLAREAEKKKAEDERVARIEERKRKEEEAKAQRATEQAAKEAERAAKIDERKRKEQAERDAREADRISKLDDKKRKEAEAQAARDAERVAQLEEKKRKEAEAAAARDAVVAAKKKKEQEARDKLEAERLKKEAARLAKLDPAARKAEEARLGKLAEEKRKLDEEAALRAAQSGTQTALAGANLVGLWATTAQSNAGRLTMLFQASATNGTLVVLGPTQRVLSRQIIAWHADGKQLTFTGGQGILKNSTGKVEGDTLTWAGRSWQRVRGRTTKVGNAASTSNASAGNANAASGTHAK